TAPHTVLVNEGFDLLYGGAAQGTTPEQATAYAPFAIDAKDAVNARLVTVAPGAGPTKGDLLFNDRVWTRVWNYTGTTQIGVDDRDVTALLAGENLAGFRSDADYMEAAAAFLVVEYPVPAGDTAIILSPGWNFVSTPKRLADGANTFAIFDTVDTAAHSIQLYDGLERKWRQMAPTDPFRPLDAVWVYANKTCTVPLTFAAGTPELPPAKDLGKGWNAIGFTDTVPETANYTLQSLGDHWSTLIGFDAGIQEYDTSIVRGATGPHGDERLMQPMQGYWLYVNAADTLGSLSG
ncbi:MAG TPA: DUF3344 domain-containing protein, partial [Methanoculleus sp.]|nr:DUF3344 domain-containing protein [Methanoculleus sp.]